MAFAFASPNAFTMSSCPACSVDVSEDDAADVITSRAIRLPKSTELDVIALPTRSMIALASIVEFLMVMLFGASMIIFADPSVRTVVDVRFCVIIALMSSFRLSTSCDMSCFMFGVFAFLPAFSWIFCSAVVWMTSFTSCSSFCTIVLMLLVMTFTFALLVTRIVELKMFKVPCSLVSFRIVLLVSLRSSCNILRSALLSVITKYVRISFLSSCSNASSFKGFTMIRSFPCMSVIDTVFGGGTTFTKILALASAVASTSLDDWCNVQFMLRIESKIRFVLVTKEPHPFSIIESSSAVDDDWKLPLRLALPPRPPNMLIDPWNPPELDALLARVRIWRSHLWSVPMAFISEPTLFVVCCRFCGRGVPLLQSSPSNFVIFLFLSTRFFFWNKRYKNTHSYGDR